MKNRQTFQLMLIFTVVFSNLGLTSIANAKAPKEDEIRYIKAMAEYLYEENQSEDFTVKELLDDGYEMCEKLAESGGWENLAQEAIRSGLGLGGSLARSDNNDQEMAKLADKYLCDS